ncbi:MAG: glycine cleavage system protein GcvH [Chloroflexi bacterium]|nr:glycine cleavage system protein GcvH [Chloroflexota bacterium]
MNPEDLKYSKEHEWARVDGKTVTIGITQFAAEQLGDVVYVDLPAAGASIAQFAKFGEIESVKTVSDLFTPVGGKIVEVNGAIKDNPEKVNEDTYGEGWLLKIEITDAAQLDGLMDAAGYESHTAG